MGYLIVCVCVFYKYEIDSCNRVDVEVGGVWMRLALSICEQGGLHVCKHSSSKLQCYQHKVICGVKSLISQDPRYIVQHFS